MTDKNISLQTGGEPVKFIVFDAGGQRFCIDTMSVREIRGWIAASPLPYSQDFLRGVINLRGNVLPVIDLAARLGFPVSEPTMRHVIIVAELPGQIVGLLAEAVSEILEILPDAIQPTPDVASAMAKDFVRGMIAAEKGMISVLRLDKLAPKDFAKAA